MLDFPDKCIPRIKSCSIQDEIKTKKQNLKYPASRMSGKIASILSESYNIVKLQRNHATVKFHTATCIKYTLVFSV